MAYVLGAGSENASEVSAEQAAGLAGTGPLVILGDEGEILHLVGAWWKRGERVFGETTFVDWMHEDGESRVLALHGVHVMPETEIEALVPVAYWNLNETTGRVIADVAGTAQNGYFYGCRPDLDDTGPSESLAPFGAETSAQFHGKRSEYIAVAHDQDMELDEGTVQLWFRADSMSGRQTLLSKDHYGYGGHLTVSLVKGQLQVRLQSEDQSYTVCGGRAVRGQWTHLAFVFGSGGMKLYLNGYLVGQNGYAGGLAGNDEPLAIGGSLWTNRDDSGDLSRLKVTDSFRGHIDEVAVFGEALNGAEIAQLMTDGPLAVSPMGGDDTGQPGPVAPAPQAFKRGHRCSWSAKFFGRLRPGKTSRHLSKMFGRS